MNKKEFKTKVFGIIVDYVHDDLFKTDNCVKSIDEFWNWINQNYIPKEKVEGLKMEKKSTDILGILGTEHRDGVVNEGWNEAVDEINQKIDNLFKDFKQVSNPLDPYDKP